MQNATVGFEDLDVKLVSDGSDKYVTSYYGGSDSKTDSNGLISKNFTLKFRIYDGSSTPDEATTTLYYHYGVRAKAYNINMTTSHTETVIVPSFWKQGLIKNLNSGHQSATIQDAIDNASSGDVLQLWDWDYVETNINVTERVTIVGNSSGVSISGGWQDTVLNLKTNTITIKNLTIKRSGNDTFDSCIHASLGSSINIDNVTLDGCNIGIRAYTAVTISNVTVQNSVGSGIVAGYDTVRIENSTVKNNGGDGISIYAKTVVYNNSIKSNTKAGVRLYTEGSYSEINSNTIDDNDEQGILVGSAHHVVIKGNTVEDNEDYGIQLYYANFTQLSSNTVEENDGGLRTIGSNGCNITSSTFKDNNGKGIWFTTNSDSNNIRDSSASGSSSNDIELDSSNKNTGFNFTFGSGSIDVDSDSDFRIMNSLNIKFVNGSTAFVGVELELFNYDTVLYASPFYGGSDGASGSDGFIDSEFTVAYEIYNGSSTTEDVQTFLKYSYGVRGKQIEIDMSTSHTETIDVPSFWIKGLVRNTDTSTDYYKIQDAIDNASAGDTLHIWAWTYYENLDIDEKLTIIGNGTTNTTINGTWSRIISIQAEDVTVKNLKLVSGSNTTSLIFINDEDAVLESIEINGGYRAIEVAGKRSTISNSQIIGQSNSGIQVKAEGLNLEISNSIISDSEKYGIYVELGALYVNINNNTIHNNSDSGIRFQSYASTIRDNVVVDNGDWGIEVNGRTADDEDNVITNNTILRNADGIALYKQDSVLYDNIVLSLIHI